MYAVAEFENLEQIKGNEAKASRAMLKNPITRRFLQEVFVEH